METICKRVQDNSMEVAKSIDIPIRMGCWEALQERLQESSLTDAKNMPYSGKMIPANVCTWRPVL
jgi:hypothetical protein